MKLLYKIFGILLVVLIFNSLGFAKAETLEDLASDINDIKEEINSLESSDIKESIAIDKALQELDKVMEFVNESVNNGDVDGAISTLEFMETSLKDVSSFVPNEPLPSLWPYARANWTFESADVLTVLCTS